MHEPMAETPDATTAPGGIPLDLAPLLAPYRQHAALSLTVERLPPQARLSRGTNNGDSTWSLKPEDLDGLAYLPPNGMGAPPVLAIRVISLDGDGATMLARLEFPVPGGGSPSGQAPDPQPVSAGAADAAPRPRAEAQLAVLEQNLAERSAQLEKALEEAAAAEAAHARTIAALKEAQGKALQEHGAAVEARLAEQFERRLADARAAWESEAEERLAAAVQEAVQKAEEQARAEADREGGDDAALAQLRDELATVQDALAARESELSQAKSTLEEARGQWQAEADAALSKAEEAWQAAEAERLAAAEAQWREQSEQMLAEATARCEQAEAALAEARTRPGAAPDADSDAELSRLRAEMADLQKTVSARESELSQAKSALEEARGQWQAEADAALSKAEEAWQAAEAERLAAAEAQWREQSEQMLAEATARCEQAEAALAEARTQPGAARDADSDAELARLRDEVATLEAALASCESELERTKATLADSKQRWHEEARAALSKAKKAWQAGENERLAAAYQEWQKSARVAIPRGAVTRAARGQRWAWAGRRVVRWATIAACLLAAVVFYPRIEPVLLERWWPKIVGLRGEIDPWLSEAGDTIQSWGSEVAGGGPPVVSVSAANLRAGPSTTAAVVAVLPGDAKLTPLERRGRWVLVRTADGTGTQGWIHGSLLRDAVPR